MTIPQKTVVQEVERPQNSKVYTTSQTKKLGPEVDPV